MTQEILAQEPQKITAGDTVKFHSLIDIATFPDPQWTVKYKVIGTTNFKEVTATVDGDKFLVTFTAAETTLFVEECSRLVGTVENGTERFTLYDDSLEVITDLGVATGPVDTRTYAKQVLDAIDAVILGRASKDQESYSIDGRTLNRTALADLLALQDKYKAVVVSEERAEKVKQGLSTGSKIGVVFVR